MLTLMVMVSESVIFRPSAVGATAKRILFLPEAVVLLFSVIATSEDSFSHSSVSNALISMSVASSRTEAVNSRLAPVEAVRTNRVGVISTGFLTITLTEAAFLPRVAVITASPSPFAMTLASRPSPEEVTSATASSVVVQFTAEARLSAVSAGVITPLITKPSFTNRY